MIGKIVNLQKNQIIDKQQIGDLVKVYFKTKEKPDLIYSSNLITISTNGNYTVLVTGDDKDNLEPEAQNV
jgi:hypothetical protein